MPMQDSPAQPLFADHPRAFAENRYVYPVVSRRAGGVSIGVNLNLDKVCNFDCVYCQVDRTEMGAREFVEIDRLVAELDAAIGLFTSGRLFDGPQFANTPPGLRRLNDIALSGDGEPTTYRNFEQIVSACAEARRRHGLDDLKIVLITNASMFHRDWVRRGLEILDRNHGEIWAKLDAGTEDYYKLVARTSVFFWQVLNNILDAARVRPLVIQSLFMRIRGEPPSADEQDAYCERLCEIVAAGGQVKLVQVHTVARPPAESFVSPLADAEVDALANLVRRRTGLAAAAYYG